LRLPGSICPDRIRTSGQGSIVRLDRNGASETVLVRMCISRLAVEDSPVVWTRSGVRLSAERLRYNRHRLRRLAPARVEPQVGDRFDDLIARQAALDAATQLVIQSVVISHRSKGGDGDEAAIARRQLRPPPHIAVQHIVGERRYVPARASVAAAPRVGRRQTARLSIEADVW